ncbi:MAG: hypothetical protein WDM77_12240 [Steroidobacteraceae bacterium]
MKIAGPNANPEHEYAARLAIYDAQIKALTQRDERVGTARLIVALFIVAIAAIGLSMRTLSLWWTLPLLAAFAGLLLLHGSVRRARAHALRAAAFYHQGLDRINDRWIGGGHTGERFTAMDHVTPPTWTFSGRGSLFELLCAVADQNGRADLGTVGCSRRPPRQKSWSVKQASAICATGSTCERTFIRRATARSGYSRTRSCLAESANQLQDRWIRLAAFVLPAAAIATAVLWVMAGMRWPFLIVLLAQIAVVRILAKRLDAVAHATERGFENLRLLSGLLTRIESERFAEPALQALQSQLVSQSQQASRIIARLGTITDFASQRDNIFVRVLLEIPLLYSVHLALAAQSWRSRYGAAVRPWLSVVGHLEALSSLAMYAYEHPGDPFPQLAEGAAVFEARELGHPLLGAAACVRNDVSILHPVRTLLVSGSNMSGKSTLLRAVGINTVLAMAGAPVRAAAMRLTPLQVGASIHVNDSLEKGHSRFYAEISRLKALYELSGQNVPLLFLLDEMLQGTNSKDRRIGAEGVVRAFIERGAVGLISTHDLALADITGLRAGALHNVHFQDSIEDGRMSFDFRLRDGVVTKSNGIELMRAIGLKV